MLSRGILYKEFSRRLEPMGIHESADQLNRKVNRKRFSAAFLFACLCAMDVKTIKVADLNWGQNK
ncbi:DUF6471 domain-containing protein [Robbsia andropogonis]|nr:DUF6471 domain-containing protein [Robbsia andropogonis]MCP1128740.1 DUF6471 domain-containing protein [Robbsia andropogonis]